MSDEQAYNGRPVPQQERAEIVFEELKHYVPESDVEGEFSLRYMWDMGMINLPYLEELLKTRRWQFLKGESSPNLTSIREVQE